MVCPLVVDLLYRHPTARSWGSRESLSFGQRPMEGWALKMKVGFLLLTDFLL